MTQLTNVYNESKRIIQNAMRDKKLVIFVGAGADANSKIPLWSEAIKKIKNRIDPPLSDKENDFLKIPQFYFNSRCEKEYIEFMKELFKYSDKKPNDIHRKILEFNPSIIITTNYSDFLERAAAERGLFPDVIEQDRDLPYTTSDNLIIKMHGGFESNNFVLKEDDYLHYSLNFPLIETYIKAVFASKVVLFVGYSYNDPDTKQLFSLVKSILSKDFQHAYMINASDDYDENISRYYKNLGINLLYYQKLSKNDAVDKSKIYENTLSSLEYLLSTDEPTEITEQLYSEIAHLDILNYVYPKMLYNIFYQHDAHINNDIITLYKNNDLLNMFQSDSSKSKFFNTIESVLVKANITKVIPDHGTQAIYETPKVNFNDNFYDCIDILDYTAIKDHIDRIDFTNASINNEEKYKLAHGYYMLGEYVKCYNILKQMSGTYRSEKNSLWFFITEFNRYYLARIIKLPFNIDEQIREEIESEAKNINLLALSSEYSGKYSSKIGNIMNELLNFKFVHSALYDVVSSKNNVEKQANNMYNFVKYPEIDKLDYDICSFYNFLKYNHLLVDRFGDVKTVFKQYVEIVLYAITQKQRTSLSMKDTIISSNIVLEQLPIATILFAIRYFSKKELEELINKYEIKKIEINDDTADTMVLTFNNLMEALSNNLLPLHCRDEVFNAIILMSYINLSSDNLFKILDGIINLEKQNFFNYTEFCYTRFFLWKQYNFNKFHSNNEKLVLLISVIAQNLISIKYENSTQNLEVENYALQIDFCCNAIKKIDANYNIDETMLNVNILYIWKFAIPLYKISNDETKQRIRENITQMLKDSFSVDLYTNAVCNEIIDHTPEFEDKLYQCVEGIFKTRKSDDTVFSDDERFTLQGLFSLRCADKLITPNRFNVFFSNRSDIWNFLYNMDSFDYSLFDLSWLDKIGDSIKTLISQNENARNEIGKLLKKEFASDNYDKNILTDYAKYYT